jgi:hypothetical protein
LGFHPSIPMFHLFSSSKRRLGEALAKPNNNL